MERVSREERQLIRRWILQSSIFILVYSPALLWLAGDFLWGAGWLYITILIAFLALHPVLLIPINPALLAERARGTQTADTKQWDRVLTMIGPGLMPFLSQTLSAIDHRLGWSGLSSGLHLIGTLMAILGYGLFLWAMVVKAYFAEGVRIQSDRGHTVSQKGPYRIIRHPGYSGSILAVIGTPLILDTVWGLIPAIVAVVLIILRTVLEDRTLQAELDGYGEYKRDVRYKLFPGLF